MAEKTDQRANWLLRQSVAQIDAWVRPVGFGRIVLRCCLLIVFTLSSSISISQTDETEAIPTPMLLPNAERAKAEAINREASAGEDPLAAQASESEEDPVYKYRDHTSVKPYASARVRYTASKEGDTSQESDPWDDGGSRAGISGELQFRPRFWLLGRAEVGFNLGDSLQLLKNGFGQEKNDDAKASIRLLYGGVQTPSSTLVYGKNWSTYYQVASITDRFESFGGDASGTFNAQTDGGPTGTGRADNVWQGRFTIKTLPESWRMKPSKFNLQLQPPGESIPHIPGVEYTGSKTACSVGSTRSS